MAETVVASGHDAVPDAGTGGGAAGAGQREWSSAVPVPSADAQSRLPALFEVVTEWLKLASVTAVAHRCRLSWDQDAATGSGSDTPSTSSREDSISNRMRCPPTGHPEAA